MADERGREEEAHAPGGGGISDVIQRQRAQQRRNSTEDIPVEIFCPPPKPGRARTAHAAAAAAERGTDSVQEEADEPATTTHGVVRDADGERQWSDGEGLVATDPALAGKVPDARAASVVSSEDELIRTELSIDLSAGRGRPTTDSESDADPYHSHSQRPSANAKPVAATDEDCNAELRRVWSWRAETDLVSVLTQMSSLLSAQLDGEAEAAAASADSRHVEKNNNPPSTSTATTAGAGPAASTGGPSAKAARPSAHLATALSEIPEVSESGLSSPADSAGTGEGRGGSSTVATPTEAAAVSSPLGRAVESETTAAHGHGGNGEAGHGERPRGDVSDIDIDDDNDDVELGGEEERQLGESGRPTAEKLESLRQTLEAELGDDLLLRVYRYLRASMETQSAGETAAGGEEADERTQGWLSQQLGAERVHLAQGVFRLILYEDDLFN